MERPVWAQEGIDPAKPTVSRSYYDRCPGGSYHLELGRVAERRPAEALREQPEAVRRSRTCPGEPVRPAATENVTQCSYIGWGAPASGSAGRPGGAADRGTGAPSPALGSSLARRGPTS